jgi:hypothetical protein
MKRGLFRIHIETRGDDPAEVTDAAIGDLVKALAPHSGTVNGVPSAVRSWRSMFAHPAHPAQRSSRPNPPKPTVR